MDNSQRAKIFMPFDALNGFREALRAKERIVLPRKELCEDELLELDRKIHRLHAGSPVLVTYYEDGEYLTVSGRITKIDGRGRSLGIGETEICFDDVYELEQA